MKGPRIIESAAKKCMFDEQSIEIHMHYKTSFPSIIVELALRS